MVKRGRASVVVCSTAFSTLGRAQAQAMGEPGLPIAVIPHPFGTLNREEVRRIAGQCVEQVAKLATGAANSSPPGGVVAANCVPDDGGIGSDERTAGSPPRGRRIEVEDDLDEINKVYSERRWGDGLPVVPPTPERVGRMLRFTRRAPQDFVARLAPGFGAATVERIATNAVLAGCLPEYLPVLIAATAAVAAPEFNLQGIQATTNPAAVWIIVNGPVARRLEVNATFNCLGQGARANATIGRALRLILQNIGGALPGEMDRATHGHPGKYTLCCAENEAASPYSPLHVERGFAADTSTVTVVSAEGMMNMNTHTKDAGELLRAMGETLMHPPSNEYCHGGEPWLVLGTEHAQVLHGSGLTKQDIKRGLWEQSKMRADRMTAKDLLRVRSSRSEEFGGIGPDTLLTIAQRPEDIWLIVAGGPGTHSIYVPGFGNSRAVTREVDRDS